MSLQLRASRARAGTGPGLGRQDLRGDPGIFGDIFKTATSFIRDPIGTAIDLGTRLLGGGSDPVPQVSMQESQERVVSADMSIVSQTQQTLPIDINFPFHGEPGAGVTFFGKGGGKASGTALMKTNGACPSGMHLNRSGYFLKTGQFIPPKSKCVPDRRMNPLNPRSASRAIKRLGRAQAAVQDIERVKIQCKRCGNQKCVCVGRRKLC